MWGSGRDFNRYHNGDRARFDRNLHCHLFLDRLALALRFFGCFSGVLTLSAK
jgi:hypothetical protein